MLFEDIVKNWDSDLRIRVSAIGCGFTFARLLEVPGASKIIEGIYLPYSEKDIVQYIANAGFDKKFLSERTAYLLSMAHPDDSNVIEVGITGAITTNRYRRGPNMAYICIRHAASGTLEQFEINLDKPDEEEYANMTPEEVRQNRLTDDANIFSYTWLAIDNIAKIIGNKIDI